MGGATADHRPQHPLREHRRRSGGGLYNGEGSLTVIHSTLSRNTTSTHGSGGGIYNNQGTLTVGNSTLSGNTTDDGYGGGIYNNEGSLTVGNSTLAGNSAYLGGGFYTVVQWSSATVTFKDAVVAKSHSGGNCFQPGFPVFSKPFEVVGVSFATDDTCPGFKRTTAAQARPRPAGGQRRPHPTHALLPGSRAIDSAALCWFTTDQRGVSRPQGAACDVGAFELNRARAQLPAPRQAVAGSEGQW